MSGTRSATSIPCRLERGDLARIVGQQPDPALAERLQHPRGDGKVALVVGEAEPEIGVDRVEALILQRIGPELVDQADAAPFLPQIEEDAPARGGDRGQRGVQLRPAIAFERAQSVAGQAFAVDPDQRRLAVGIADDQRDMLGSVAVRAEGDDLRSVGEAVGQAGARDDAQRRRPSRTS